MGRSTPSEMSALREAVFARDQHSCCWPGCDIEISPINPLELGHLNHRGMGGYQGANTEDNAVALCKFHHDILDGRTGQGKLRYELCQMLKATRGL